MKTWIRSLTVMACMAVFVTSAFPQGALGKGKGGGGNQKETGGGKTGPGRDKTPPPTGGNTGPGRDRTPPPTQGGGPSRDRDKAPPTQGGLGKGNGGGNTGPVRDRDRDRTPPPTTGGSQGGGLDRGRGNGGNTGDLGRSRDTQTGGVKPIRGNDNQNQGQLGRIDNPTQRGNSIRNGTGRVGSPSYGTNNNQLGQITRNGNSRIDRYEVPNLNKGSIASQAGRIGEARVNNRYRSGYYQYNNNWRDDSFCYPHYQFNYGNNCSVSPWYYYSNLPGYISYTRIVYVSSFSGIQWGLGSVYNWNRNYNNNDWRNNDWRNDRYDSGLDDALDDIQRAWERGDKRAIGRLVPSRGRVNIYHDGRYSYSLNGDDFYDMLSDAVYSTETDRYEIIDVRTSRDGAQIKARHTYTDGWGQRSSVIHSYRLVGDRYGYEIADFSTSYRNLW